MEKRLRDLRGLPRISNNYDWPGNVRELKNVIEDVFFIATMSTFKSRTRLVKSQEGDHGQIGLGCDDSS